MTKVSVVILNFNGEKFLRRFLPLVIQHSSGAEIIVADNHSTDGSVDVLKQEFPQIRRIALDRNYGFCGGYNRALQQVQSEYYLLLNSDIEVTAGWLDPLVKILDRDPRIDAVQPKILSFNSKNTFEYAGAGGGFIDSLGYPFCRGRVFDHVETDLGQYNDEREIFWATGACLMVRSSTFHKLGGLDEDFFAHMEEIDLCWRIARTSQKVYYTGKSTVYHVGAGTLGYDSPFKTYLNFRNGLSMIFKHLDAVELIYKFPSRIVLDWLAAVVFLVKGKTQNFRSVFRAHLHFFRGLGAQRRKRRVLRQTYPSYSRANIHPGLIIFDYYLRKKKQLEVNSPRSGYAS